eukprot:1482591-Rhodomonas_salina.1
MLLVFELLLLRLELSLLLFKLMQLLFVQIFLPWPLDVRSGQGIAQQTDGEEFLSGMQRQDTFGACHEVMILPQSAIN